MSNSSRGKRWTGWLTRKPSIVRPFPVLRCEELEDRRTPTQFTWTGLGGTANWSNPANWSTPSGPAAPTGLASEHDDLVFPQLAGQAATVTTTNDIVGGVFNSISFSTTAATAAYNLTGNALTLGEPGVTGSGFVTVNAGSGGSLVTQGANGGLVFSGPTGPTNTLAMAITLGASAGSDQFFTVQAGGALNITGQLTDSLGSSLTQEGAGILGLSGNNQTFTGTIKLDTVQGNGTAVVNNANALGGAGSPGVIVGNSAGTGPTLEVNPGIGTALTPIAAPVRLNGTGTNGAGALLNLGGTNVWTGPITLDHDAAIGASAGTAANPSVLNVMGVISDTGAGHSLFKEGGGEVQLNSPTGNTYRGLTTVDNGVLTVGTASGLGFNTTPPTYPDPQNGVVVNSTLTGSGQLRLLPLTLTTVVTVPGTPNASQQQTITNYLPAGGTFSLTFGGQTTGAISSGATGAQVQAALNALSSIGGVGGSVAVSATTFSGGTTYTVTFGGSLATSAQPQIAASALTGVGFTVVNKYLTLNDNGVGTAPSPNPLAVADPGALTNALGTNTWAGPVILGSPAPQVSSTVQIGAYSGTNLIISGIVSSPNAFLGHPFSLIKVDPGMVVLSNANTYTGGTDIRQGIVDVRDSQALGTNSVTVENGATLQLDVEAGLPPSAPGAGHRFADGQDPGAAPGPRDLWNDSVTGDPNRLQISNPLTIRGLGFGGVGALYSESGINVWTGTILLGGPNNLQDAIGVAQDLRNGHPTPSSAYITSDYSLNVSSVISGGDFNDFVKTGAGDLILSHDNTYTGLTRVEQGWVTVETNNALGGLDSGVANEFQPGTYVSAGAAVHLLAPAGTSLSIPENIFIAGTGPTLPYEFISQKGSLVNLDGNNTWTGTIGLIGQAGIGVVETVPTSTTGSTLTVTGAVTDGKVGYRFAAGGVGFVGGGNGVTQSFLLDVSSATWGVTSEGILHVYYDPQNSSVPSSVSVYEPPPGPGPNKIYDTGAVNFANSVDVPIGTGATTVALVANEHSPPPLPNPPGANTSWVIPDASVAFQGGLIKLGFGQLALQGPGTYTEATDVLEGTLLAQNNTALGLSSSGTNTTQQTYNQTPTTVQSGAVLILGQTPPTLNGGIQNGVQLTNEQLILNNPAQQIAVAGDETPAPGTFTLSFNGAVTTPIPTGASAAQVQAALNALPTIQRPDIQTVQVIGTGGAYTLTFNGQTTAVLPVGATPGQVQAALDALPNIGGAGGNVTVSSVTVAGGTVYTIVFGGSLANLHAPQVTQTVATTVPFASVITVPGTASTSEVETVSDYITDGAFTLTFNGQTTGAIAYNATGPTVQAALNALSTIGGAGGSVTVTAAAVPGGTAYTISFGGSLANSVQPLITAAALPVSASITQAGTPTKPTTQAVQVFLTGAGSTFTLSFNGQTTAPIAAGASAAVVQAALNALSTVGGAAGSVTVTQKANTPVGVLYTITFAGSLAQTTLPVTAAGTGYLPTVTTATTQTGLNGNVTVTEVPRMNGTTYLGTEYDVTFGGDLANASLPVMGAGMPTASVSTVQPGSPSLPAQQTVSVNLLYGSFTLTFKGATTGPLLPTATAADMQAALNALPTIAAAGGSVTVTQTGSTYTVTFGGALATSPQPQMTATANGIVLPGVAITTQGSGAASEVQSVFEVASNATFTLSYKSQTTPSLPITATALQVQAAVNTYLTSFVHDNADTPVTVTRTGNVFTVQLVAEAGDIGRLVASPSSSAPFVPELSVSGVTTVDGSASDASLVTQYTPVQALTVTGFSAGDTVTLSFNGQSTPALAYNATAAQIQAALNALSTIGGVGGSVTVYQTQATSPQTTSVYSVTFGGALAGTTVPLLGVAATAGAATASVAAGPNAFDYAWRGPVTMNSGTRIATSQNSRLNLLSAIDDANNEILVSSVQSGSATQSAVQVVEVFGNGGAFTLTFNGASTVPLPYNATAAQVQDALNTLSTLGGVGGLVTVTSTPVPGGTRYVVSFGSGLANTAVPLFAATSLSLQTAVAAVGGPGQSAQDTVTVYLTTGTFLLTYNGQTTAPLPFNASPAAVAAALTALTTIGSVGGTVTVTAATSTAGTVYTITFGGTLANKALSPITAAYNGADLVKRGQGELLLGGSNSFRGTTYVDQGVVTAANSQAFGATLNGTVVAANAQLQTQGSLTIAGEPLTVSGNGVPGSSASSLTNQWFNVGPSPTNNGQTSTGLPTSGRIVSVAADPTDPSIIYIATAGGGAWKTTDNGYHWTPLFDSTTDPGAVMWGGAIAVAPSDSNTIYFGTGDSDGRVNGSPISGQADNYAGTGVYRSTDAGKTWTLLTNADGTNPLYGLAITQIVVNPLDPTMFWAGSSNIVPIGIGGTKAGVLQGIPNSMPGVYRFTPAEGWYDMTGDEGISLFRQVGGVPGQSPYDPPSNSGGSSSGGAGAPGTPGPDDDYRLKFPTAVGGQIPQFAWNSLSISVEPNTQAGPSATRVGTIFSPYALGGSVVTLYASLYLPGVVMPGKYNIGANHIPPDGFVQPGFGQQFFEGTGQQGMFNAVYRSLDPQEDNPSWFIGDGNYSTSDPFATDPVTKAPYVRADSRNGEYPVGAIVDPQDGVTLPGRNGMIEVTSVTTPGQTQGYWMIGTSPVTFQASIVSNTVYATNLQPDWNAPPYAPAGNVNSIGQLLDIQKSTLSGNGWAATGSAPAFPFGQNTPTSTALGTYDAAILVQNYNPNGFADNNANVVYLAGENNIYESTDGGNTWNQINPDASGNGPGAYFHTLALDVSNRLLSGSDGGIWRADTAPGATRPTFNDLNGDLAITQLNGVDAYPTDINQAIAGTQNNGIQELNGTLATGPAWDGINPFGGTGAVNGGQVAYDPQNPLIAYAVLSGSLYQTQNGGASWTKLATVTNTYNQFPIAVDPVNGNRLVIGGSTLSESKTGGSAGSFVNLQTPLSIVTAFGLAQFQGPFVADPAFPQVTDQLANTYTPGTLYATDGSNIEVTKNEGVTWVNRGIQVQSTTYTIQFGGSLGITNLPQLTAVGAGGAHVIVSTTQVGHPQGTTGIPPQANELQTVEVTGNQGSFTLTFTNPFDPTNPTESLTEPYNVSAAQLQTDLDNLLNIGAPFTRSAVQTITEVNTGSLSPPANQPPNVAYGAFTLSFKGATTTILAGGPISTAASAAQVQAALEALPGIGAGNVSVTSAPVNGGGGVVYTVTFQGALANQAEPLIQATGLTVSSGQISGGPPTVNKIDDYMTAGSFSITFTNSSGTTSTITEPWNVSRAQLEIDLNAMNAIAGTTPAKSVVSVGLNADINGISGAEEYTITFAQGPLSGTAQQPFVVAPVTGGGDAVFSANQVVGGTGSVTVTTQTAANVATVTSIAVDPSDRDTVYVTESYPHGEFGPQVFRSTDAGQTWVDITGSPGTGDSALPNGNAYSATVDPRTGTLYIGTDNGVWQLPLAAQADTGGAVPVVWSRVGAGMPAVKVTKLVLNQTLNTLTAATYGRSAFQLFLTDYQDNTGAAVRAVSGSTVWTGPVALAGNTTIAADGNQNVQNGITAASLNIIGTISDATQGGNYTLTVGTPTGSGTVNGSGTVIFSGANTYGGKTVVQNGILEVNNPNALGAATATGYTVVNNGAQLALESDLESEAVTINGDGIVANGVPTGALRNVANNNTFTGTLTLGSATQNPASPVDTIGVDSGTTLTIGAKAGLIGTGTVTDAGASPAPTLHKESTGTLILASANSYGGLTVVDEGALQVQDGNALGAGGTNVYDGAQVQIARNAITLAPTIVPSTAGQLTLAGTGIFGTGALVNVRSDANPAGSNDNVWAGPIVFTDAMTFDAAPAGYPFPAYSPQTTPGSQVAVGVADSGVPGVVDTLTLNTAVQDSGATPTSLGLIKVGPGRLTLAQANNYTGVTNINAGSVRVQDPGSLGSTQSSSAVQTITVVGTGSPYTYQLTFDGMTTPVLVSDNGNAAAYAATIQSALRSIGILNGNVVVTGADGVNTQVFTVTFGNALANIAVPLIGTTNVSPGLSVTVLSAQTGGTGVVVAAGAALELDGDPTHSGTSTLTSVNKALTINGDGPAGSALVTAAPVTGGTVYTVGFGGALGNMILPPVTATGVNGATVSVTTPGIQAVQVLGDDGTFTLTFKGQTTAQISYNATAAQVQAALNALPTISAGGTGFVSVTLAGKPTAAGGATYLVTFGGSLAGTAQPQITAASVTAYTGVVQPGTATASEQQSVTVLGTSGTFTLTYQGATTAQIPFNATAAQLAAALNALSTIGGVGGSVTVTSVGSVFTVTFGGSLAFTSLPLLTVGSSTASTKIVQAGGGTSGTQAITVTGTSGTFTLSFAGQTTTPLPFNATAADVQAALTALTGIGGPVGPLGNHEGLGALDNVSGANTFSGPVTLGSLQDPNLVPGQAGASIGAAPGTTLTVASVQDPTPLVAPAPQLQKVGLGTVVFPNQNTYGGLTNVVSGVLRISNQNALGTSQQDVQSVTVTSPGFTLTFNGQTTGVLSQSATAAQVQAALHTLLTSAASTVSNYNGNLDVVVTRDSTFVGGARFTISFVAGSNGPASSLANTNLPAITATPVGTPGAAFTTVVQSGNGPETQKVEVLATSGTFSLTFNGLNGVAQSTPPLLFNATAAQVQAALAALPNIGAGNVVVTATPIAGGTDYTVTFVGTLANYNVPQLQVSVTGGTQATVTTLNDGPGGTTVESGATLQITPVPSGSSLVMSPEVVTINGQGYNNQGALNVSGGTVLWNNNALILGSNASIGTTSTLTNDALTFNTPITDQGNGFNLDVYGPGVVTFQATGNNQYTGTTTVHAGTLALAETGGTTAGGAVMGPLVIGDGSATAVVREQLDNQVADTSSVAVNQGGLFDLNQKTDTVQSLAVVNGTVDTGGLGNNGGHLTVTGPVTMSGGTVNVGAGGSLASGDVTMAAGAQIVAFASSTVTAGAVSMTGSSITLGNGVTLTASSLALAGSTIGLAAGATGGETVSTTGAVTLSNLLSTPSSISLGNNSLLTVGSSTPAALTLTGTSAAPSSVTLGTGSRLTTGAESVTAGAIALGDNDVWTAGTVTLDDGTITTGTGLSATTGDVTLADGSTATVGGGTVTSGNMTLSGGSLLSLGAGTSDTAQSATLTGSTIDIGAGATVTLFGNLTATSSATAPAGVTGTSGTLDFHGANPAVNVTAGPRPEPVDLLISAILSIAGSGANQLLKTGLGLLELDPTTAFPNLLNIQAGNVQVDTVAGNVALNGGTLSGGGAVGTIDNGATINPPGAIGTVSPGESYGAVTAITTPGTPTTSEVQTLWHFTATGPFALSFKGQTTGPLAATATAADVQAALTGLSTIGAGNVTVTSTPIPGGTTFTITFGGSLANSVQPRITAAPIAGAGILTSTPSGQDLFGAGTTFSVFLSNASGTHPNPIPGTDYSQLAVNGTVNLNGAILDAGGLVGPGIQNGDSFTIITATQVTGKFANGPAVFISGQKFEVVYNATSVVLQKALADATITSLVSSVQTAEVNEPVTITATVTPEAGAGTIPAADTVTFTLTPQSGSPITVTKAKDPVTGNWVLNTQTDIPGGLPAGTYAVSAVFNGDTSNFTGGSSASLASNLVVLQPSIGSLTAAATNVASFGQPGYISPNNSPAVQDTTALSATVHNELSATGYTVKVYADPGLTGTPVRTFSGSGTLAGTDVNISAAWDGKNDASTFAPDGTYYVTLTFTDPWGNTLTSGPVAVTVDNTSPAAAAVTPSTPVIAPSVASSVPTTVTLTGTVGDTNLAGWTLNVYSQADSSLVYTVSGTGTAVNVVWDGKYDAAASPSKAGQIVPDGQYNVSVTATDLAGNKTTSTPTSVFVFSSPTVQVSSSSPTVGYGQAVTFTATVSVPTQLAGFVTGTFVDFYTDGTSRGHQPLIQTGTTGSYTNFQATLTIPVLDAGTYKVTAVYPGNNNVTPGTSSPITQVVTPAPLTVVAQDETSVYGGPLPGLTNAYTVTGLLGSDPTGGFTGALSIQTSAAQPYPAGTYAIVRGSLTPDGNYTIQTFTGGTLTVTPAPLTITVDNATKQVGAPLPTFSFTAHGLVGSDTSAVVSGLTLKTTATQSSQPGTYPITAVGTPTAGPNYTIVGVTPGVLTVSPQLTNLVVGSGGGGPATVNIYSPTGKLLNSFTPFPGFTGEVRTAAGDFNGDGVQDIAVATGPGVQAEVKVFDGATGVLLFDDLPFDTFTGGAFVSAGNLSGGGVDDLAISPDEGGGPRVTVLAGGTFQPIVDFFGINDPNFRGGARTTFADVNHDGFADLVVAAGFGGGPRVSIWDGKSLSSLHFVNVVPDFFAFEPALRNGVYVAGGDVNGDGYDDLVLGAGPGGGPRVMVVDGQKLLTQGAVAAVNKPMANFFAGNTANRAGVRVATKTLAGSLDADVVTGDATGELVTAYKGSTLANGQQSVLFSLDAFPELNSGVYVG